MNNYNKRYKKTLKDIEENYRTLVDNTPDFIYSYDKENRFTAVNKSLCAALGLEADDIIGKNHRELGFPEEVVTGWEALHQRVYETKDMVIDVTSTPMPDGTTRSYEVTLTPIVNESGSIDGIRGISRDITKRKELEEKLVRSRNRERQKNIFLSKLARGSGLQNMLDELVLFTEQQDPSVKGSVLLYDEERKVLTHASAPNLPEDYNALLLPGLPIGPDVGSCGSAAFLKERVIVTDIQNSERWLPYTAFIEQTRKHNLHACWSEPILATDGRLLGTIANYADKTGDPTPDNLEALELAASIAAIAIEKNQVTTALQESEANYAAVISGLTDIIWRYESDARGKFLRGYISPVADRYLGLPAGTIGDSFEKFFSYVHADDLPQVMNILQEALTKKIHKAEHEYRIHRSNGSLLWVLTKGMVEHKADGRMVIYGITSDITERKKTEEALRESKEHLSATLRSIGDGVIACDCEGKVVSFNSVAETLTGWTAAEAAGRPLEEVFYIIHTQTRENAENPVELALKDGVNVEMANHTALIARDGTEFQIADSCAPIRDASGAVTGAVLVFRDVTGEYRRREELRRISTAVESASDAIAMATADGHHFYQNEAFTRLFGYEPDELATLTPMIIYADPDEGRAIFRTIMDGGSCQTELVMIAKNGRRMHIMFRADCIKDEDGRIIGLVGIHTDITEQKEKEKLLQDSEQRLNTLISQTPAVIYAYTVKDGMPELIYLNENVVNVLGFKPDDLTNNTNLLFACIHPDDMDGLKGKLEGQETYHEYRFKDIQGHYRWLADHQRIISSEKDCIEIIGAWWEITDRKQMEEELHRNYRFQEIISDISTTFIKTTADSFDADINYMLNRLGNFFRVDRSYLFLFSQNHAFFTNTHEWCNKGVTPQMQSIQNRPAEALPWFMERIFSLKQVHIPDISALPSEADAEKAEWESQDIKSLITVPVKSADRIWGSIGFDAVKDYYSWSDNEIHSLTIVANIVGDIMLKLDNEKELKKIYRELDDELSKAKKIHQRLFSSVLPQTENISMAGYNQPATQMGGDSYNVIRSGDKMVIYVADVSGHGLDGALLSVFIKEAIDSYTTLKPDELSPQKIMKHLDAQFTRENFPDNHLIAIFLAVLDLTTNELSYSSAGFQTNPLVVMGDGTQIELKINGLFISNSIPPEMMNFAERTLTLTPGTTIMISSDGLPEHDNGKEFYQKRYHEIFYQNSHLPPEIISQAINKDFCCFNDNSLVGLDDITYLVLQYGNTPVKRHNITIKSDFGELENLYEQIFKITAEFPEKNNLQTCLHEIVVNAIEHGNKLDPAKKVSIDIAVSPGYVLFEVQDEGEGFNWCEKLDKPLDMSSYSERGRGVALTCLMSGNLYYNSKGNKAALLIQSKDGNG